MCFAGKSRVWAAVSTYQRGNPQCLSPVICAPVDNGSRFEGALKASRGQSGDDFRPLWFSTWHSVGKDPFH